MFKDETTQNFITKNSPFRCFCFRKEVVAPSCLINKHMIHINNKKITRLFIHKATNVVRVRLALVFTHFYEIEINKWKVLKKNCIYIHIYDYVERRSV